MHVVNLSIGGPDYLDEPFVEKVRGLLALCSEKLAHLQPPQPGLACVLLAAQLPSACR